MRRAWVIFKFELKNYFQSKSYLLSTLGICLLLIVILNVPKFLPNYDMDGVGNETKRCYAIVDKKGYIKDLTVFEKKVPFSKIVFLDTRAELERGIKEGIYDAGIEVNSLVDINYIVENTAIGDHAEEGFKEAIVAVYREEMLKREGIDDEVVENIYEKAITSRQIILGKDGANNYVYTYILSFILYMMIILHGQMIAVAITTEKSNRAMEVLVTSANTNELIFGKVMASTCASFIQTFAIIVVTIGAYWFNAEAWYHRLDFIFNIPQNVLLTFALFGTLGFMFYAFIFGAIGALASRVEDVSKSISMITFIFIVVFIIGIYGMSHSESLMIKVASFVPFSSCIAMFIRVAMGNVTLTEIDTAITILAASTLIVGIIGAKIYELGSMKYGKIVSLYEATKLLYRDKYGDKKQMKKEC